LKVRREHVCASHESTVAPMPGSAVGPALPKVLRLQSARSSPSSGLFTKLSMPDLLRNAVTEVSTELAQGPSEGALADEGHRRARPYCSRLAAMCWLVSLVLPTLKANSRSVFGVEVALQFISPLGWLFAPTILVASSLTNVVFLHQVSRLARSAMAGTDPPSPGPTATALLINLVALFALIGMPSYRAMTPSIFSLPGVWFWQASFVLLLVGIMRGEAPNRSIIRTDPSRKT
jgi:hypothetical protein